VSLGKLYNYSRLSLVQGTSKRISTSLSKIDYSLPSWQTISVVASHNLCEQLQATILYRKNHLRKEETSVHFLPFYSLLYNHETIGKYIHNSKHHLKMNMAAGNENIPQKEMTGA
jgi:hypothetical protein